MTRFATFWKVKFNIFLIVSKLLLNMCRLCDVKSWFEKFFTIHHQTLNLIYVFMHGHKTFSLLRLYLIFAAKVFLKNWLLMLLALVARSFTNIEFKIYSWIRLSLFVCTEWKLRVWNWHWMQSKWISIFIISLLIWFRVSSCVESCFASVIYILTHTRLINE
jgi:hypothetical protein